MASPPSGWLMEGAGDDRRALATVEVLGALAYGQLRAFETTARAVRLAPDARTMDRMAEFAVSEHRAYVSLRDLLRGRTDLVGTVLDRQKPAFDAFFDQVPLDDWDTAVAFFAVGLPIAADFVRAVAPSLDAQARDVVVGALATREEAQRFALDAVAERIERDAATRDEVRHVVADLVGRALTGFRETMTDTDALRVLLGDDEGADRRVAIDTLEQHRRRMVRLGLDDLT